MGSGLCTKCRLGSVGCFLGTYFALEMTLRAQKQLPGEADIGGELRFAITSLSEVVALTSDTGIFPALVQHLGLFLPGAASGCRKPSAFPVPLRCLPAALTLLGQGLRPQGAACGGPGATAAVSGDVPTGSARGTGP